MPGESSIVTTRSLSADGRGSITMPLSRRWIGDFLHFARRVPSIPVQRSFNVSATVGARRRVAIRPRWVVIFAKAFALTCAEFPALRRSYLGWPWPRLYQHPHSTASIAVEREYQGEPAVFFIQLRQLDRPLMELDRDFGQLREAPFSAVKNYRWLLRVSRLWRPVRRLMWNFGLNASGYLRERRFGTFGISTYSSLGAESLHPISPLTSLLTYGPIASDGRVSVRLIYDHRVLDGATVARALTHLEEVLNGPIVAELSPSAVAA